MDSAEIPKRTSFRPAEVCAIAGVPPYVLKSWEAEFAALCGARNDKGARVYARSEVELVVRIKELVFGEGLTLGAARKKLEGGQDPDRDTEALPLEAALPEPPIGDLPGADERRKLVAVKQGLQAVLELLSQKNGAGERAPVAAAAAEPARPRKAAASGKRSRAKLPRGKAPAAKASAKRKRRSA